MASNCRSKVIATSAARKNTTVRWANAALKPRVRRLVAAGVDANRIHTISFGKDKAQVETGHDDAAWSKNRRDDFVLLHPKMGM